MRLVPEAFQDAQGASFGDRIVFAAKTVFGRGGNGPALATVDETWDNVHSVAGLTGVTLVSLGLAYVLPVLGAVAHKRSTAAMINTLGHSLESMQELLDRTGGGQFGQHLLTLTPRWLSRPRTIAHIQYFTTFIAEQPMLRSRQR